MGYGSGLYGAGLYGAGISPGDLITDNFQIEWRGTLLGHGTPIGWKNLAGWIDLPDMRLDDQPRPFRHGAFAGQQLAQERVITWDFTMYDTGDDFDATVDALRRITAVEEAPDEEPLVIQLSGAKWLCAARITRRLLPVDRGYATHHVAGSLQWVATDPRLYSAGPTESASVGLPALGTGGLVFPLRFPLTFGTGRSGGDVSVTNTGTLTTWPAYVITGPVTGPIISNVGTGQTLAFDPTFTVPTGMSVTVDTDAKTVMLGGVNRRSSLVTADWFGLAADTPTNLRFSSVGTFSPSALLTVQWRNATI